MKRLWKRYRTRRLIPLDCHVVPCPPLVVLLDHALDMGLEVPDVLLP